MSEDHQHEWKTRYVILDDRYDCASGMECKCGMRIDQDTLERIANESRPPVDYDAGGYRLT